MLRLIWPPVYLLLFTLAGVRWRQLGRVWPLWLALFATVGLAFASKYWSLDPVVTQRRVIAMAIMGVFGVYLAAVFRGPHLPKLIMHAGAVMAVGSVIMVFAFPAIGVHHGVNDGLWRGLWYEKNQMGMVMVMIATASAAVIASGDRGWKMAAGTLLLATALMLATQSKTSLLSLMLGVGVVTALWMIRKAGPAMGTVLVWLGVVAACGLVVWWSVDSAAILQAMGKDPTLTGRTDIWESLMNRVAERPWTGYGYRAFWGLDSVPAAFVREETGWDVPSAHHGWIDLLVELGWPGGVLVGTMFASAIVMGVLRAGRDGPLEGWFNLAYLAVYLLLSTSESVLMTHQSLPWIIFLAMLGRTVCGDPQGGKAPLVAAPRQPYQSRSRIVPKSVHGRPQRPFPVR